MGGALAGGRLLGACLLAALLQAALGTKLQWNVTGPYVNFPFGSGQPPFMLRTMDGDAPDCVIVATEDTGGGWQLSSYKVDTGDSVWNATVSAPGAANGALYALTSGAPHSQQQNNTLATLFVQLGGYVLAVDPRDGSTLWQHATYNASTPKISAYGDGSSAAVVYLTSSFLDTSRPVPAPINYVEALDAATGAVRWANFTNPPPSSGLTSSDTAALLGVTPLPGLAVYAQGSKLYGLAAQDGRQLWSMTVSTGIGSGLSPNISSILYVEPSLPGRPYPVLLLTSTTWEQTRFLAYQFNGSAGQPPVVLWQMTGNQNLEGSLSGALARLGLGLPQVSVYDNLFVFWSNRTSYDPVSGKPVYNTFLVARSLDTGAAVWAQNLTATAGPSKLPVSPPTVNLGVVSLVTAQGLAVMDAGSGQMRYTLPEAPVEPQAAGGLNSYVPTTSFANGWGQLAVLRCLGSSNPGTLCVYNGYDRPVQESAAIPRQRPAAGAALAAAAAAVAAGWLLL
ncbi:hypothetical protein ABPG75_008839 [Micractinium tetrahymenae]